MGKNYKKLMKWLLYIFLVAGLLLTALIVCSPYSSHKGFSYKLIKHSIEINTPAEKVFDYLGNSANASQWSSFVHHITVLNQDSFADGTAGSRRRCFRSSNEKGMQWDELITKAAPNQKRDLSIYNLVDFQVTAPNLATQQVYESIGENKCRLTFTLFCKDVKPTIWQTFKLLLTAYTIKYYFERNLSNIKRINESEQHE